MAHEKTLKTGLPSCQIRSPLWKCTKLSILAHTKKNVCVNAGVLDETSVIENQNTQLFVYRAMFNQRLWNNASVPAAHALLLCKNSSEVKRVILGKAARTSLGACLVLLKPCWVLQEYSTLVAGLLCHLQGTGREHRRAPTAFLCSSRCTSPLLWLLGCCSHVQTERFVYVAQLLLGFGTGSSLEQLKGQLRFYKLHRNIW